MRTFLLFDDDSACLVTAFGGLRAASRLAVRTSRGDRRSRAPLRRWVGNGIRLPDHRSRPRPELSRAETAHDGYARGVGWQRIAGPYSTTSSRSSTPNLTRSWRLTTPAAPCSNASYPCSSITMRISSTTCPPRRPAVQGRRCAAGARCAGCVVTQRRWADGPVSDHRRRRPSPRRGSSRRHPRASWSVAGARGARARRAVRLNYEQTRTGRRSTPDTRMRSSRNTVLR